MAIASIVAGITMIVLASFVRSGGLVSIVLSIALSALALLFLLVNIISGVVKALHGSAEDLAGVLILLVITGLVMLLLFFLIQAARAVPRIRNAQAQYQMQYWQYLQQQQAYAQQAGYGYGYPQQQAQQPSSQQPQAQPGPQQPPVDPPSPPANP